MTTSGEPDIVQQDLLQEEENDYKVTYEDMSAKIDIETGPSEKQLTTYVGYVMMEIIHLDPPQEVLTTKLYEDFHQWSPYQWDLVNRTYKTEFARLLKLKGFQLPKSRTVSEQLVDIVSDIAKGFDSTDDRDNSQTRTSSRTNIITRTPVRTPETTTRQTLAKPAIESIEPSYDTERASRKSNTRDQSSTQNLPPGARYTQEIESFPQIQDRTTSIYTANSIYDLPPRRIVQNGPKPYDILYDKAKIFISFCRRLRITEDQYHAVFPDILADRAEEFYLHHIGPTKRWDEIYKMLDAHFNTDINHNLYYTDWTTLSFVRVKREEPDKKPIEVLEALFDKLSLVQRALGTGFQGEIMLRTQVIQACRGVPELENALSNHKSDQTCGIIPTREADISNNPTEDLKDRRTKDKTKGTYPKENLPSTNHSDEERKYARDQYLQACYTLHQEPYDDFTAYLQEVEGDNPVENISNGDDDDTGDEEVSIFLTSAAFFHRTTGEDIFSAPKTVEATQFVLQDPYTSVYQGELWDTGAAKVSTVGKSQVIAYLRENPQAKVSWKPGSVYVRFGDGRLNTSIGTIIMENPIGRVKYHIFESATPFLFSLKDADRLKAYFNNIANVISHDPAPRRFKFSLKDESYFNYEIVVDVVRLKDKNALHVIDTETSFQGATFLKSLSARDTWNALTKCWINTYVGPPDHIVHDPGTNFASTEFRKHAEIIGITCDEMPVEAHWAVGKVERAHAPLRRAYDILHTELSHNTDDKTILQMAIKALNDTAGPYGIVPTLLVFGTYPRINKDSPPSPEIVQQAEAAQKARKLLQGIRAEVEINRAINTRNGPNIQQVLSLPIQSEVMKEKDNYELAVKLRLDNIITTPGLPYEESDRIKIDALINQGVFTFIRYDPDKHSNIRIFRTRMVREIKNKTTKPYEKSRLVIQGYGDQEKEEILTQAPTIQRMSQRLLLALGPTLVRDFKTIIARLPRELEGKYPERTLLHIVKPLYGLAESGLYWYKTYATHHKEDLGMIESTYNPCLLYTTTGADDFGITAMQTDDTMSFATASFSVREEEQLEKKGLHAKPKTILSHNQEVDFNGGRIQSYEDYFTFLQKGQVKQLNTIEIDALNARQQYVSQRARGAYLASICQPEASYDLAVAAQIKEPSKEDIEALNVRLQWQIDNPDRGLKYIPLDFVRTKMYIFTDGSFANNTDLSSQLGFVIVLAEETARTTTDFEINRNIIH
ncbi:reverse transcriptase-like protein [Colletotrichum truncatum]|uniref:Reverse transcriptase-like protein n=1 Tax=Colletotrichum truncatum TaxID=5467 RepID=A0ACC3YNC9_COLTU